MFSYIIYILYISIALNIHYVHKYVQTDYYSISI